jgi:hypothetical protein
MQVMLGHEEGSPMQLGEIIASYDVAVALRGESGKFEVTTPAGNTFRVTCKVNHSIANLEWSGEGSESQPFMIRKVAELVSLQQPRTSTTATPGGTTQARPAPAPFLLEQQETSAKPQDEDDLLIMEMDRPKLQAIGTDLDLYYAERDPLTGQPAWGVCLKGDAAPGGLITSLCVNFNDLDVEIRRLHAQLDEIRSRVRRHFYKAQSVAASA